ncbi:MAG TPA: sugar ABC transporter permease [Firmicutes bacterium]|nr:sugar ABC transporter permease [Candidatus Fermentithermobacillaceae bacterium]
MNTSSSKGLLKAILKKWDIYLFIAPFFILYTVFMLFPIVHSFWMSLHWWDGLSEPRFIGVDNYRKLISEPLFLTSLKNTAFIFVVGVPIMVAIAVVLGVLLNRPVVFRKFFRTVFFMPVVVSLVVVAVMFILMYDFRYGVFNYILEFLGLDPVPWITSPDVSKLSIILLMIWRWSGYNMVIVLAGLQNISPEYYEAARIDGAGAFTVFWRITLPLLKPILLFIFILSTIGTFQMFAEPYILTKGGPMQSTYTIVMYLYREGFQFFNLGYASAVAYVLVVIIGVLTILQLKFSGDNAF